MTENCLHGLAHLFGSRDANRLTALRVLAPRNISETGGSAPVLPSPFHPLFCEALLFLRWQSVFIPSPRMSLAIGVFCFKISVGSGGSQLSTRWKLPLLLAAAAAAAQPRSASCADGANMADWLTDAAWPRSPQPASRTCHSVETKRRAFFHNYGGGKTLNHDH